MAARVPFERKNIRLPAENYRGQRLYFVTLCFHHRRRFGANPRIARWIIARLRKHSTECEFFVHVYCVMPDHVHFFAAGAAETSNLLKFVEAFKQDTGVAFERKTGRPLWQFKYYDHILRGKDSADRVAWYIWMNPVRKGLSSAPGEFEFAGSFTELGSKMLKSAAGEGWSPPWKKAKAPRPSNAEASAVVLDLAKMPRCPSCVPSFVRAGR